ncbi:MAG: hypothetical protein EXS08_08645 [Planctomycetes bacterium]|nr:hypothetical protein [Planctomycetota bacterium]
MILTTLLALATLHGVQTPQTRPTTSTATAESAEILRHILGDALEDGFAPPREGDQLTVRREGTQFRGLVTTLWANDQTVQQSRVFHLPEVGLFFALDAALPVVKKKAAPAAGTSDQPTDDEWEKARRELRGDPFQDAGRWKVRMAGEASEIDPQAIEKTIDLVLRTCARHATRVEGLAPQETITIALRLSGKSHAMLSERGGLLTLGQMFSTPDGESKKEVPEGSAPSAAYTYLLEAGGDVREQNLVIRIALSDLTAAGDSPIERLRLRALINRY